MKSIRSSAVWVIARLTFREAARRWVLWAALLLGLLFLTVFGIAMNEIRKEIYVYNETVTAVVTAEAYNLLLMMGLYVVNFLAVMMAVLTSVDTLSGEIGSGTIHTLVSKPLRRWEIVLGKWCGFVFMLTLYLLLMAGGVVGLIYLIMGYTPPHLLSGLALMWLNVLVMLGISLAGGSAMSTLANGVMVFGLYGVAFLGGWIEQFGVYLHSQAAVNIGVISSLLLPCEAIWRRAAFEMQSPLAGALGFSPFNTQSVPSPAMIVYAALFALGMLALAAGLFCRRDL
jgi:ABC-type transport system involved in multi-copper enzyme maturation permease subunit